MNTINSSRKQILVIQFFILVVLISLPFWIIAIFVNSSGLPDNLPVTDIGATFVPMVSAIILTARYLNKKDVKRLLARIIDIRKLKIPWLILTITLMPIAFYITYFLMKEVGINFPANYKIPINAFFLFIAFFIAAIGEEIGYMGFVIDRLLEKYNTLKSGLIIGVFWSLWHLPSMIQIGQKAELIIIGLIATIAFRVLYSWLYIRTNGCVFSVILMHAIGNTARSIFPGGRTYFEKMNGIIGYSVICFIALLIIIIDWKVMTSKINK